MDAATREAIVRAAGEHGIEPAAALAIAERESNFDPKASSSKTIRGMFQMTGTLRRQYGVGDSSDPYAQAKGWGAFFKDNKAEMARVLGRDPTDAEGYLGHHVGGVRAARMLKMDPATPVDQVFTRQERRLNPHFDKAGTVGALNSTVLADIDRRQAKFGAVPDYSEAGSPALDYSGLSPIEGPAKVAQFDYSGLVPHQGISANNNTLFNADNSATPQPSVQQASGAPDFSQFGVPA